MEQAIQETTECFEECSPSLQKELIEQKEVFELALTALHSVSRAQELEAENKELKERIVNWRKYMAPTREQVEKVWRGGWVKRHKHYGGFRRVAGVDDTGEQHAITIDERCEYDDLYCTKCGKQSPDNFLNFCSYCGTPMTDEAVQMVMERLEALHEDIYAYFGKG